MYCRIENKKEEDGRELFHISDNTEINGKLCEVVCSL
jgi:adenine specific DNA methylase Mod